VLALGQLSSMVEIKLPGINIQMPLVFPTWGFIFAVAESETENGSRKRRLFPDRCCSCSFLFVDVA
jgi:hypothetical protein